jgi:alkylated DNA repair dioxygenase AlkB
MKQYKIFDEQIIIPGLKYVPEYISAEDELQLINFIDSMPWNCQLKRRTQHYGYQYDYKAKMVSGSKFLGPMPPLFESMCERLYSDGVFSEKFDQIIVNEYLPGQGIAANVANSR